MTQASRSLVEHLRTNLLVRVLAIYGGASWVILEVVSTFGEEFGLPTWFFPVAVALLIIGLPIILATAAVQSGFGGGTKHIPLPDFELADDLAGAPRPGPEVFAAASPQTLTRWLTWKRSILGGVLAFTTLGVAGAMIVVRGTARVTEAHGAAGDAFTEREWIVVAEFEASEGESEAATAVREALTVDLQQSQYVNVYTPAQVSEALRLMELPDDAVVDAELAREIAQRQGLAAVVAGRISRLGADYMLAARVLRSTDSEELVAVRTTAGAERIVDGIEALSREVRSRLGESRAAIRASQPLPEVTTRSLEALRRYAQAVAALAHGDQEQAADLAESAIELDPEFAMAYRLAASAHGNLGRGSEAQRYTTRAYELRDKLPERERLHIEAYNASVVLVDPMQTIAKYELILSAYPDDGRATNNLANEAREIGDFERAYDAALRTVELEPYGFTGYANAVFSAVPLGRFAVAESLLHLAAESGIPDFATRWLWLLDVASSDWARADAVCDSLLTSTSSQGDFRADDEALCGTYDAGRGRIERAVGRLNRGAELFSERGRYWDFYLTSAVMAQAEMLRGRRGAGRRWVERAQARHPPDSIPSPDRPYALYWLGLASTTLGDVEAAQLYAVTLAADTSNYYEASASLRLQAFVALAQGDNGAALENDRAAVERDFGHVRIEDLLVRAQAFDQLGQRDSAITLYEETAGPQTIGANVTESWYLYAAYLPVAHRRLGELYEEAGDAANAAEHYNAFLELWSDADAELRPQLEAVRRALERLGAERAGGT